MKKIKEIKGRREIKNEDKQNVIDITNTNLVKDKVEKEEKKFKCDLDVKKTKTKLKKKKNAVRNSYIDTIDENEMIEFTESMPITEDCKRVAFFDFT